MRSNPWPSWRRACAENADHPRAKELFDRKKLPAFHDPFAGGGALPPRLIERTPRIGVGYAGAWAEKPLRFVVDPRRLPTIT